MNAPSLDPVDRALVLASQDGLPLCREPWRALAEQVGIPEAEVIARLQRMLDQGAIRRIGAIPNHYRLGYTANGMSVWDVTDERVDELGMVIGALPFVSHCYRRPRALPIWPYNLFAMVHGQSRDAVAEKVAVIAGILGPEARAHQTLYSSRILKKSGLRLK
ncbi:MAG: AsnC family transcriptional regulator [Alphaproteobacteria bacterium]|nr:AsnC family transcriptional regulator [Alphaproteobacteria bacterium]